MSRVEFARDSQPYIPWYTIFPVGVLGLLRVKIDFLPHGRFPVEVADHILTFLTFFKEFLFIGDFKIPAKS